MSPEALNGGYIGNSGSESSRNRVTSKSDVYSFGILLWELITLNKLDFNVC
jgi:hypothetical protein